MELERLVGHFAVCSCALLLYLHLDVVSVAAWRVCVLGWGGGGGSGGALLTLTVLPSLSLFGFHLQGVNTAPLSLNVPAVKSRLTVAGVRFTTS
jgi:hypothetical protein